jgi:RNA 2',3'-cyclic 3'-phosphodiesterase
MSVIRAFIAIDLSDEIYQRLEEVTRNMQARLASVPIRWVPVRNIHVTLKFLGDVSIKNLEVLKKLLETETRSHQPFEISVGDLGAFPSERRPRVLWAGVQAPQELTALQRGIEVETARLGYAPEDRPFSPHLTLGRIGRNAESHDLRLVGELLKSSNVGFLGATRIQAVHLYRSDLQPGGAVYTQLHTASLALSGDG